MEPLLKIHVELYLDVHAWAQHILDQKGHVTVPDDLFEVVQKAIHPLLIGHGTTVVRIPKENQMTMHYCLTSDGMRIVCICTTGRDHTENEMDLTAEQTDGDAPAGANS